MSKNIVLICMLVLIGTSCIFAKQTATATRTLTVVPKLVMMGTPPIPDAVPGSSGSFQLAATGGVAPYTFRAVACVKVDAAGAQTPCVGVLPPGYTLTAGGLLSWTPTESGKFQVTFEAADSTQ